MKNSFIMKSTGAISVVIIALIIMNLYSKEEKNKSSTVAATIVSSDAQIPDKKQETRKKRINK